MMNTSNLESNYASQTTNASSQPLPGAAVPTFPFPGAGVPAFNYAIALQQHQFQQSLVNQQLLAQQQAVAHAVSIKAAAEQAAARAAEISKLLKGETDNLPKEKSEETSPKKEKPESKSHSQSPSALSSKSTSRSPIRYRNRRKDHNDYSPRDRSNYRTSRYSNYYTRYDDHRGHSRSSYRRDVDWSGGRSYSYYRGRSPSRFRSSRYHRYDSHSPQHHHVRSPSLKSGRKISSRVTNRHNMSKSPINSSSSSPRKPISRSLSSSENSPSPSTRNLFVKDNKVNRTSHSTEDFLSDLSDQGQKNYSNKKTQNKDADKYVAGERHQSKEPTHKSLKLNIAEHELPPNDRGNGSDVITVEEDVDETNQSTKGGTRNHDLDLGGHQDIPGECAIYPLPEANESKDGKEMVFNSEHVSMTPNMSQFREKGCKLRARSKERRRKHSKRDHKRRQRVESEEEDDHRKKCLKEGKLRRDETKGHKRHHKTHNERKRRKRKHRDMLSSSSSDDCSSSDDLNKKNYCTVPNKGSMGSSKKRRSSPHASTRSS